MRPLEWVLLGALALAFAPALRDLAAVWGSVDHYSHGPLVPLVAGWTAARSPVLRQGPVARRDGRGLAVVALALVAYALGLGASLPSLEGAALVAAVAGVGLHLFGPRGLARLSFPVGFLLFMVPLPASWLAPAIVWLQLAVSAAGAALLQAGGLEVVREGNVLVLPGDVSLFVAEACSGITSIVTLAPLAVALAYLSERTLARRLVLVASVVPLAMLGNLLRVIGTVLAANAFGARPATEGPLHEAAGVLAFALSMLLLLGVGSALQRLAPARHPGREAPAR
jgi:exosortase